jgi:ADP-ribose pyrophosphatase YjhB (NUDIX family)
MSEREPLSFRVMEAIEAQLRRRVSTGTLRRAYRAAYLVLRPWWFVTRPHTSGVKSVVRCGERVLLVRHTYARRDQWDLPGGFLRPGEDPERALRRELAEELGVEPVGVLAIARTAERFDFKREQLHTYVADVDAMAVAPSPAEIAATCWVARDALPPATTRFARQMIARSFWELWTDPSERLAPERPTQ